MQINDLVIVKEEKLLPLKLKMDGGLQIYQDNRERFRIVKLMAAHDEINRAIHKLVFLMNEC